MVQKQKKTSIEVHLQTTCNEQIFKLDSIDGKNVWTSKKIIFLFYYEIECVSIWYTIEYTSERVKAFS